MKNVMVDIETLGSDVTSAPVISIAAVYFDLQAGTIERDDAFFRNIDLEDALKFGVVEAGTLKWWQTNDKHSVFKDILFDKATVSTTTALSELTKWVGTGKKVPWAKGTDFDFVLLDKLYRQTGEKNPFSQFWARRDMRTFVDTCKHAGVSTLTLPRAEGLAHNALSDVFYQCEEMIAYSRAVRKVEDANTI